MKIYKSLQINKEDIKEKSFIAYASTFGNVDSYGDIIEKGSFKESIKKSKDTGRYPKLLYGHYSGSVCGIIKDMEEDDKGLLIEGEFIDTTKGRDTHEEVKTGAIDSMSIGFFLKDYEIKDKKRYIKNTDLFEVSFVAFPANDKALVQDVKAQEWDWSDETLVKHLEKNGWICKKREDEEVAKTFSMLENLKKEFV